MWQEQWQSSVHNIVKIKCANTCKVLRIAPEKHSVNGSYEEENNDYELLPEGIKMRRRKIVRKKSRRREKRGLGKK